MSEYISPLVYQRADPFCYRHTDGFYYFTATVPGYDYIELRRARTLNELGTANSKIIWKKHGSGEMGSHIWAPEIHRIGNKWYIYFAAGEAENEWNIRPYALMCEDDDLMEGEWKELGRIDVGVESFSLDMTAFTLNGRQYNIWAQTLSEDDTSSLYIAEMDTPVNLKSAPMLLTKPEYDWETRGIPVNEGPAVLIRNGKIFVAYSASNTGANYCMGMLWCDESDDVLDIGSWHKMSEPVFKTNVQAGCYGPGHNCFTSDGESDVLIYHARNYEEIEGDPLDDPNRHTYAKKIVYDKNGFPVFD
ncbi:MAG: family 43 glycosylhydrolase [Firmicutes bacterium]|nr:family 43 glycosylhydrolase [Bacillota bacterium]